MLRQLRNFLAFVFVAASFWLAYDNVLADNDATQAMAEAAACGVKDCKARHGLTRTNRSALGQDYEFTWQDGVVRVSCRRPYVVAGARQCTAR